MLERLIESWLDRASERSYQAPFCQMLISQGYTVVHSTRHPPIEFGKDVIAIASDGVPCAFQLKGNPGSRLTHAQLREIQPQLIELATQAIIYPGVPKLPHRSYLVTNGIVDEEVQRAIDDINRNFELQGLKSRIEILSRGHLLQWAKELGEELWPSEIEDLNLLLQLLVQDGHTLFPVEKLHLLLLNCLLLNEESDVPSGADVVRRIASAGLLTGICLQNFNRQSNHFAAITAWAMFAAYAIACCERYSLDFERNGKWAVDVAEDEIFGSLKELFRENREKPHLVEGDPIADVYIYRWRYTLLAGLMSVLWFWLRLLPDTEKDQKGIELFLKKRHEFFEIWGEGCIPQLLAYIWFKRATNATPAPDFELSAVLEIILHRNQLKSKESLPSPYYKFEEIAQQATGLISHRKRSVLSEVTFAGSSFFAEGLMHLLTRTGLKQTCKRLWPDITRLGLKHFEPESKWRYCLWRTERGQEIMKQMPPTKSWNPLVEDARDAKGEGIPEKLKERKLLLMLFTILFPYRATPSVIRYLGRHFNECWFIAPPIE